jgi:hypothetical protein
VTVASCALGVRTTGFKKQEAIQLGIAFAPERWFFLLALLARVTVMPVHVDKACFVKV